MSTRQASEATGSQGLAMRWEEWVSHDAVGLAALVRNGEVTAKELALQVAAGIEALNPELNAVLEVFHDRVGGLDAGWAPGGPLAGVPFPLKDVGAGEKGRLQEWGSRIGQGVRLPYDSFFVEKLRAAGINFMARTAAPEFGFTFVTESALNGVSRNPWNTGFTPGGSSGGAAAITAAGIVPLSHANDGGGSIRLPASICGLVGLKVSRARISDGPVMSVVNNALAVEGCVSRTVRDTATLIDAARGPGPGEVLPFAEPERPYVEEVGRAPGQLRIAVVTEEFAGYGQAPEITAEVRRVADMLAGLGHAVEEFTPPFDLNNYIPAFNVYWMMGAEALVTLFSTATGRTPSAENLEPVVLKSYEVGQSVTGKQVMFAQQVMNALAREMGAFFTQWDLILTPTLAQPTPEVGSVVATLNPDLGAAEWLQLAGQWVPYTPLCNLTGIPAISLPLAQLPNGLPLGMHFMAPVGREDVLLRLAGQLEEAVPWTGRVPEVHVTNLS